MPPKRGIREAIPGFETIRGEVSTLVNDIKKKIEPYLIKNPNVQVSDSDEPAKQAFFRDNASNKFQPKDFDIQEKIGEGACGKVMKAKHSLYGFEVAVKKVKVQYEKFSPCSLLLKEIKFMFESKHQNIIETYGCCEVDGHILIIMPLMFMSLDKCCQQPIKNEAILKKWASALCDGLNYIHGKQLVHNDLKLANILIDGNGKLKLCDFGSMELFSENEKDDAAPFTFIYRHPQGQMCLGEKKVIRDIWSLGICLIEIRDGKHPFADFIGQTFLLSDHFASMTTPPCPKDGTNAFKSFVQKCLLLDIKQQIDVQQLKSDVFLGDCSNADDEAYRKWITEKLI